jgi:hypothetical protein
MSRIRGSDGNQQRGNGVTKHTLTPLVDRLAGKFLIGDGCWEWIASKNDAGYGQIASETRPVRPLRAHRVIYELFRGSIPAEMTIDHLCRNRGCVRPDHMEIVSRGENVRRGHGAEATKLRAEGRTQCKRGHSLSGTNVYLTKLRGGRYTARSCRACHAIRERSYRMRRRVSPSL